MSRLAEIRKRLAEATPGPWESHPLGGGKGGPQVYSVRVDCPNGSLAENAIAHVHPSRHAENVRVPLKAKHNSTLIANAPTDLEWACKRIQQLEIACESALGYLQAVEDGWSKVSFKEPRCMSFLRAALEEGI